MTPFLAALLHPQEPCGLLLARNQTWLADRLELAFDSAARKKGLLGRQALAAGCGLVIAPSQGVHTFGMRFPLDIVALDRDGRVVKYRCDVPPRRIVFAWSAFAILEVAAGTCARAGLIAGDRLLLVVRSPETIG